MAASVFAKLVLGMVATALGVLFYARWPHSPLPQGVEADRVLVVKSERKLRLYRDDQLLRVYRIALGFAPTGAKQREGDGRTPEGHYLIDYRNPKSGYFRSLHISYPTKQQVERAEAEGVSPGGMVMIHGLRNDSGGWGRLHRLRDWTAGCIALTNDEMAELWRVVPDGTPIEIRP